MARKAKVIVAPPEEPLDVSESQRIIGVLASRGFGSARSVLPGCAEWSKVYERDGYGRVSKVTIILRARGGIAPVGIEGIIVTTQEALPNTIRDIDAWVAAQAAQLVYDRSYVADLKYIIEQIAGQREGTIDALECSVCHAPAQSWILNAANDVVCALCQ